MEMRARLSRIVEVIDAHGLKDVPRSWAQQIEGKLWDLQFTGADGVARAFYVTASGRRLVVVRIFVKKTQETPKRERDLAFKRARGVM